MTKHEHCGHAEVSFCGHCGVIYCKDCPKEWGDCKLAHLPFTYIPWTYPYTTTFSPCNDTYTASGGTVTEATASSTVSAACSHDYK